MILVKIVHILWFNTILPVYLGIWPPSGRDLAPLAARGWPRNDEKNTIIIFDYLGASFMPLKNFWKFLIFLAHPNIPTATRHL